jgi:protein-tyrosine phosphatase
VSAPPARLLFLCTGNYYRSRFVEELFNARARDAGLNWVASSRGIATELGIDNVGPMSIHAARGLRDRGVPIAYGDRCPMQLEHQDLAEAHLVIAVKEAEHRPLLQERFPAWTDRVCYWHIDDLDAASPEDALAEMEGEVSDLIECLSRDGNEL